MRHWQPGAKEKKGTQRRYQGSKAICSRNQTCNAPMPAFPRVHMDGAVANALANAFLHPENHESKSTNN